MFSLNAETKLAELTNELLEGRPSQSIPDLWTLGPENKATVYPPRSSARLSSVLGSTNVTTAARLFASTPPPVITITRSGRGL